MGPFQQPPAPTAREFPSAALGHARDPCHRVDAVASSRHVRVSLDGVLLADSRRTFVIAWTYQEPRHDAEAVGGRIAFFDEHVDIEVDGQRQSRPTTPWSAPRWWERIASIEAQI
jgi:uncharacterized protein (DUF427 family)